MIRKLFHIGISVLLMIATTGVTVSKHYSGGILYSYSLTGEAQSCCENDCACCHNSANTYRLIADYIMSDNFYQDDESVIDLFDMYASEKDIYHVSSYHSVLISQCKFPLYLPENQSQFQSLLL
jgi:hypothetical protein